MTNNIYWLLELTINDGQIDNLNILKNDMIEATQSDEPGTLNYEWHISDDSKQLHVYERYADSAATMTHIGNFGAKFADRFLAILSPTRMTVYGDPSTELREALAGFEPVFMQDTGGFAR
jgi:quinol monooxygenase YgiN